MAKNFAGFAHFHHNTAVHKYHAVRHFAGKPHLVGHHNHRHAILRQLLHHRQHLAHHFRVQRAGRLVKQHNIGLHRQRAGNCHALLLPARKLGRVGVCLIRQAHLFQQLLRFLRGGCFVHLLAVDGGHHNIFHHRKVGKQVKLLKHHADIFAYPVDVGLFVHNVKPVHDHLPAGGLLQPVQAAQKRRFAAARRPDHANDFPLGHF
ncbi:hypothetical protein SDC9_152810 [bioreactor metagenome]|uniref:Uncharacterized protein n=1 Tax=bioreactor metagenome TaxID=1076179 RepID=A0A645EWH3_9ZZZZ